jgi:hypothetical protein
MVNLSPGDKGGAAVERTMYELKVYTNKSGQISIEQQSLPNDDPEIVIVHPDPVDRSVQWLQEAKADLGSWAAR